jgi:acetyl-CoA C-acetyltransferase
MLKEVVIVSAVRTPIGDFGGSFRDLSALQLGIAAVEAALQRAPGLEKEQVEEIIFGNCGQRSYEPNIARCIALEAGFPVETTGFTIQRQCSSAMQSIACAYQEIQLGDAEIIIAGGVESMSAAPYLLKGARWGQRLQHGEMTDSLWEMLTDPVYKILMGETAERLADKYSISREEQDVVAARSHQLAIAAIDEGRFDEEIVPVSVKSRRKEIVVDKDEHPRRDISLQSLTSLKPAFRREGTVTAGNSSGLNDGAAAVVVMSAEKARELNLQPMARIVSYAWAGVEPDLMGYGPVPATRKVLKRAGMSLGDMELIELNEAFAAQYLACEKLLELDRAIVNVNGSGIGLGHPVGATGARIVVTLLHEMKRRNNKFGLATLCVGGGLGMAMVFERI